MIKVKTFTSHPDNTALERFLTKLHDKGIELCSIKFQAFPSARSAGVTQYVVVYPEYSHDG